MKLIIDIPEDMLEWFKNGGIVDEYDELALKQVFKNGIPLDDVKADMRGKSCNTCKNSDDEFSGECYECVKNIQNHYKSERGGEWIPVTERLPEKSGEYLIAIKDRSYTEISWFYPDDKKWSYRNVDVVAWANIPEPYKAESEDKECI